MNYLNLGCGYRFHHDWTNVNFMSTGQHVIVHDLREHLPFPAESFDVIYHSHVLEHFPKANAGAFLLECYRVLRPNGIIRVVVPDLEQIVKAYLLALEQALAGSAEGNLNYDWMMLELYDQTVRNYSGGEMANYLNRRLLGNETFILTRIGGEIHHLTPQELPSSRPLKESLFHYARIGREWLFRILLRHEYQTLQLGRFRQGGEVHQWMYDRYSLSRLLTECGFQNIVQRSPLESSIPDWNSFYLDTESDGSVYKPDSLYMEGFKLDLLEDR